MPLKLSNVLPEELLRNTWDNNNISTTTIAHNLTTTTLPSHHNSTVRPSIIITPPCQWILYKDIADSRVRIWDLMILIPNSLFLLFLLLKIKTSFSKLKNTSSPIFLAFYGLVWIVAIISVLRCVVSMTVNAAVPAGDIADRLLWLILRFFLLSTELSVITFGLAFGHLDSQTSIKWVLLVTSFVALAYSFTQGALEFTTHQHVFHVSANGEYDIFGHGGMLFWLISSICFFIIYSSIVILPFTPIRERFALPSKRSFYIYVFLLSLLNMTQAIGSGLLYGDVMSGLCVVDVTTYLYFTCFAPFVYLCFLREFFATSQTPNILFSYKAQVDDGGEEDLNLPHQSFPNSPKPENGELYDSTQFEDQAQLDSPNPLYNNTEVSINADIDYDYYQQTNKIA
ncbi:unnamed protein product [Owenia fusiformis]|uniref:Uncharacterized protein n=1 Tax=Owenia fusiformis TaxID=6347 RepID=A0A8J1T6R9_OWEFU|nr:unnamed protein product [Owenia fusiformis]